jgi:large subunit ribosomal protein L15
MMQLNTLQPAPGAKKQPKRLGRGIGSGLGKTCGRGHKGQRARAGGFHKIGFEGGQMPIQRRLPKFGFKSRIGKVTKEIRLHELMMVDGDTISLETLREAGLINASIKYVKIILSGEVTKPVKVSGIPVTKGARAAIEAAGGVVS